jgi:hypothetical protein
VALQNRPLRPFEKGAHLHVLDWAHDTARYRLQDAGRAQVKAATKAIVKHGAPGPPRLPALETAITSELHKLYALGHATVRSELDHQRRHATTLPVGLSAAPAPPRLRKAKAKKGLQKACATCHMFDNGVCWGYGNHPVRPNQVCDSYTADPAPKQLARGNAPRDPASLATRGRLVAEAVAHAIHQAVTRGRLHGITSQRRLRDLGEQAGHGALRAGASSHAGGAISAGRHAAAQIAAGEVIGARYTSILDKNTCGPCAAADDGVLRALDDPALQPAPNPDCLGGDRCRCIWVYQLRKEGDQHSGFSSDELRIIQRG